MARKQRRVVLDALRRVPLFADCTDAELHAIDGLMTEVSVAEGTAIIREGEGGREFVIVSEGTVRITRGDEVLAERGPGAFIGEIALLDGSPRNATVVATSAVRAYVLNRAEFETLVADSPDLRAKIERTAAQRRV